MDNNKKTIIIVIGIIVILLLISIVPILKIRKNYKQDQLIKIPYANQMISSEQEITADMISFKNISSSELEETYYTSVEDIIGKCVKEKVIVGENSMIYYDTIAECPQRNDD